MSFYRLMKKTIIFLGFNLIAFFFILVFAEGGFRLVKSVVKGSESEVSPIIDDEELGWALNPDMTPHTWVNKCGEEFTISGYASPYLIKEASVETGKTVLALGDSLTQRHGVSVGGAYFDILEKIANGRYRVYAAGAGGYGSVQQYLVLKHIMAEVEPDLIVWQLAGNDIINNVYAYEKANVVENNQRPRPYLILEKNEIEVKGPTFFLYRSKLFRYLFSKAYAIDFSFGLGLFEWLKSKAELKPDQKSFFVDQGLEVLRRVVSMVTADWPDVRVLGFANVPMGSDAEFESIFNAAGYGYIPGLFDAIASSEKPMTCLPLDEHLNHKGHQVLGEKLLDEIDRFLAVNP